MKICGQIRSKFVARLRIPFILLLTLANSAHATNLSLAYHGRILKPDGTAEADSSVQFKMQIYTTGTENCLLYEETQTKDLSASSGAFSISINDGTGSRTDSSGLTPQQIFSNRIGSTVTLPASACSVGSTYSPGATDTRNFLVAFKDSTMSSWEPLPVQKISHVPFAIESIQVGGFSAANLLRVEDASGPQSVSALTPSQASELANLANGSSTKYVQSTGNGAPLPSFATDPTTPAAGDFWYDSANKSLKFYNGTSVQTLAAGMGVTSVTAGAGLNGGTITSTGTISMPNVGSAGTYTKVTTDAQGRVSSGSQITGDDITSGTIAGSTAINTSGNIVGANVSSGTDSTTNLKIFESTNTNAVTITAPAALVSGGYGLVLPTAKATVAGQVLTSDTSGNLSWTTAAGGTITGLTGDVTGSGSGSITTTVNKVNGVSYGASPSTNTVPVVTAANTVTYEAVPNAALANSSITLGSTSVSLGATASSLAGLNSVGVGTAGTTDGSLTIANTNSSGTVTIKNPSAASSYNFNLPATAGTSGQVLLSAGGGSSAMTWGTLTVGSGGTGLSGGTQGGIPYFASSSTMASSAALAQHAVVVGGGSSGGAPYTLSSLGNSGSVLISAGASADPAFGAIDLTSANAISGILPVANGGTGTATGSITGTGALIFSAGGTNQNVTLSPSGTGRTILNGNVGIGTSTPRANLDVVGTLLHSPAVSNSTTTIDFATGNLQYTTANCGAFQLNNMKDGGAYAFVVKGATSATCSFTAYSGAGTGTLTVHLPSDHAATTANKHTYYNFTVFGSDVYIAWNPGY